MNSMKTTALAATLGVASLGLVATASAGTFTVDDSILDLTNDPIGPTEIDRMTGGYNELLTLREDNTFDATAYWNAGQFFLGGTGQSDRLSETGDNADVYYGLYATFNSSGTFDAEDGSFTGTSGEIEIWLDPYLDTTFAFADNSDAAAGLNLGNTGNDILVGYTDYLMVGEGSFEPGEEDIGSYALVFGDWVLTEDGGNYFTSPDPFFDIMRVTGQFDFIEGFDEAGGTYNVTGSADVRYREVPAPGVLALFGIGLLALGLAVRRRAPMAA